MPARFFNWGSRSRYWDYWEQETPGVYMAHVFIPDGVQVNLRAEGPSGQEFLHVFGVQVPGGGPPAYADCANIAGIVGQWVFDQYKNMWPASIVARQVTATALNTAPAFQANSPITIPGVRAGAALASEMTLSIKASTIRSGKRNRGGSRPWPGVAADYNALDRYQAAYVSAMANVFNSLLARMTAGGYALAIKSLADRAMKPIFLYTVIDDVVDSQRRRTINRGR